jgi:hypothetical protein
MLSYSFRIHVVYRYTNGTKEFITCSGPKEISPGIFFVSLEPVS